MGEYPEHDKLQLVAEQSHAAGEVLEWLFTEKKYFLAEDGDEIVSAGFGASYTATRTRAVQRTVNDLLAEFFGIDQSALEAEKRALLQHIREAKSDG